MWYTVVMTMTSVDDLKNIRGKRVLVRVDLNVPIERGAVADDTRIQAALPTIDFLCRKGAGVILGTHYGRPDEIKNQKSKIKNVLEPIAQRLGELLHKKVQTVAKWDFELIHAQIKKMKVGQVLMLPNLRLHPGEEKNSPAFARELAGLGQVYVNEAFSVCHRKHASVVGVPQLLPAYAGFQLMREVETLGRVLHRPETPLVVLMGGGKITDKMAMLKTMVKRADAVLVGGALATHFFKVMGYGVGASRVEAEGMRLARTILGGRTSDPTEVRPRIVLPRDVVVGTMDGENVKVVGYTETESPSQRRIGLLFPKVICVKPYGIWDIGPQTILKYAAHIKRARTLIWNGPMGLYEVKRYSHGTLALGRLFAARSRGRAFGVAGGGETIDALKQTGLIEYVDFISTGGGAMLEFLGGKKLPGIVALYGAAK